MSKKNNLFSHIVAGNREDQRQRVSGYYYPPEGEKCDKIAIYFSLEDKETGESNYARRSTFFSSFEQLKSFLTNVAYAVGYWMQKRGKVGEHFDKQLEKIAHDVIQNIVEGKEDAEKGR